MPRRELREAIANVSFKTVSLGIERICRLVVVLAWAPVLGGAAFGRFVFASAVTSLLAFGSDLGLGVWTTRALARDRLHADPVVLLGFSVRAFAALPYALAVAAVALAAGPGEERWAIAILGGAALANGFVDHAGAVLRGYERFDQEAQLNGCRALATATAGLVTLTVGRSLLSLCAGLLAASLAGGMYACATMLRFHSLERLMRDTTKTRARALVKSALRESLPLWMAGLLSLLYFKADTLFLRVLLGDAELGAYGAAFKLFEGSMIAPSILLSVAFPKLARARAEPPTQRRLERRLALSLTALGLGIGGIAFAAGAPLVTVLFGVGFHPAVASLRILSLGLPLLYLNYGLTHFLVARDEGRATTWLALMMLVVNVALDAVLIPRHAGPGAACATVLSELTLTVGCLALLRSMDVRTDTQSARGAARTDRRVA
ncbi:MAG: oligosaccharide flippase family protein [Myxococcota bacterium]|nr:oligosaccharide flippase family protein [Myxococcota bacterium]